MNGSYAIRATGIFQLDKDIFIQNGVATPGYPRLARQPGNVGPVQSLGQMGLGLGRDAGFRQDLHAGLRPLQSRAVRQPAQVDPGLRLVAALSHGPRRPQLLRRAHACTIYGFSPLDDQKQIPIIHPVIDHDYVFNYPIFGGELGFRNNLTSLSRDTANFDPISQAAVTGSLCAPTTADPAVKNSNNCLLRGVPGNYTRASTEWTWRRTVIDACGQMFTPFVTMRADVANMTITDQPGVSNYINVGETDVGRVMPTAGVEYRYPLISVQSWGTQTIEPIAQLIVRPNETNVGSFPNEDAQSLIFDDFNLFKVNKFSGWDRVEGGGRANVGVQYTAQFNRGGNVNVLFGQSYQLFGTNSFALGGTTNTGLNSGLDTAQSDYVARASYQPNSTFTFTSRFRFDEDDFTLQRTELETSAAFGRWTTSMMYGNYAAQPAARLPRTPRGRPRQRPVQSESELGPARCGAI